MVVGVEVSTSGSDMAQLAPMVEQFEQRAGRAPEQWLVGGGFPAHEQLDAVAHKTEVYAPVPKPGPASHKCAEDGAANDGQGTNVSDGRATAKAAEPVAGSEFQPKPGDSAAGAKWRQRMDSAEAREIYKDRAATAECVNAQMRNHGLQRMPMRGLLRARAPACSLPIRFPPTSRRIHPATCRSVVPGGMSDEIDRSL
jgi:hypothetical protein